MVRAGYKQTEVGVIPEDWEVKSIGELNPFVTSGSRGWAEFYSEYGHPFIRITNLSKASIYLDMSDIKHVSLPAKSTEGKRTKLENGDILVSITADIGIIGYITETLPVPSYINQHISLIRFAKKEANTKYIAYFLTTEKVQQIFRGSSDQGAKAGINLNNIRSIKFATPSLKEQTAIATALSDIDALITALTELIDKKRQIKTATMQQLLTGKQRLAGFGEGKGMKQTELGEIPEDWEIKIIKNLVTYINDGTHYTPQYKTIGVPFYSVENVTANDFENVKFISEQEHIKLIKRCKPEENDILMTRIGSIGDTKLIDWKVNASIYVSLALIKFKDIFTAKYFHQYSKSNLFKIEIEKRSLVNATPKKINTNAISNVPIILPTTKEQQAIAQVLSDMDDNLNALETRLTKTKAIKQGMMQELLTGRTRLI